MDIWFICNILQIQLTLDQHVFELHGPIYMQVFFDKKNIICNCLNLQV